MTELLGYAELKGAKLTHLAPVYEGGYVDRLSLKPLCRNMMSKARIRLGAETPLWKSDEAEYKTATEGMQARIPHVCPRCWNKITRLAIREDAKLMKEED